MYRAEELDACDRVKNRNLMEIMKKQALAVLMVLNDR